MSPGQLLTRRRSREGRRKCFVASTWTMWASLTTRSSAKLWRAWVVWMRMGSRRLALQAGFSLRQVFFRSPSLARRAQRRRPFYLSEHHRKVQDVVAGHQPQIPGWQLRRALRLSRLPSLGCSCSVTFSRRMQLEILGRKLRSPSNSPHLPSCFPSDTDFSIFSAKLPTEFCRTLAICFSCAWALCSCCAVKTCIRCFGAT